MRAETHPQEAERLAALRAYAVLDTPEEAEFDDLVALAARICETPISVVTLVDSERQWFKARVGIESRETPFESSICAHAILQEGVVEVSDTTLDARFRDNPLVTGKPGLRFYAGALLESDEGLPLGTLCVLDTKPRHLTDLQRETLRVLGRQVMAQLELRRRVRELEAEKAARAETAKMLELVTDRMPVRVGYLDRDYRYRFVNGEYERAFGLAPGGGVGLTVAELAGEPAFETAKPYLDRALAGETHTQEFSVAYPFGERRVEVRYGADQDADGDVQGVVIHVQDVTDRYAATQAIAEERARQDRTLENAQVATFDWDVPNDRVFANPLLARFFGVSEADARGGPIAGYFAAIHPDDREATIRVIGASLEGNRPYETQYRVVDAEGHERWVLARGDVAIEGNGQPRRLSGVVLDISERVRAEEAKRASDLRVREAFALLEGIVEGTREVMVAIDRDFRFTAMNEAFRDVIRHLFGKTPEVGGDLLEVLSDTPEDRTKAKRLWERALAGEEVVLRDEYGDPGHARSVFDLRFYPIRNDAGEIVGAAEIARDVTEQATAEAERERLLGEVAREQAKLRMIFEQAPAIIAVLRGPDLVFDYVNQGFYGTTGHRPVLGLPIVEALPEATGGGEGQDYDRVVRHVLETGERLNYTERPVVLQRSPGAYPEERFLDLSYLALREADGTISGVLVHGIDVTEGVRSRRAIREREELFRTVFEQAPDDAIIVTDAGRTITAWNPAAERICGWSAEEAIGGTADLIFTPEDRTAGVPGVEMETAAQRGKAEDERWHMRKDGTRFWGSGTMNSLHADGAVRGYLKVFRDATERYEETQTLAFLSLLTEAVIDQRDPDRILETVERMLGRYLGVSRVTFGEFADDEETFTVRQEWGPEVPSVLGTYRLSSFGRVATETLRAGKIHVVRDAEAEIEEGSVRETARSIGARASISVPVVKDRRLAALFVVHHEAIRAWTDDEVNLAQQVADRMSAEIERARAEAALRTSEERFRQFVNLSPATVWFAEPDGGLSYISQDFYEATGLTPEEALPNGWTRTVHPEDLPHVADEWTRARRDETRYDTEFRFRDREGVYRWLSVRALPVRDADGRVSGWIGGNSDIQERKTAEATLQARVEERTQELQRAVQEAEGFNYSISHDLRTPLRAMVATSSILLEEAGESLDEEHRALLVRQAENAKRLGRLIDELLRLSRLARVEVRRERLDMTEKATSVFEEIAQHGESNGCALDAQTGMSAEGDSNLVRTVLQNLVGNACKFSPHGGTVRVRQAGGVFTVSDEGVGFDMRFAAKVFLPFERLVSEAEFAGTGIGLANVKRIVERHGGRVWVESSPGQGATFSFTLG